MASSQHAKEQTHRAMSEKQNQPYQIDTLNEQENVTLLAYRKLPDSSSVVEEIIDNKPLEKEEDEFIPPDERQRKEDGNHLTHQYPIKLLEDVGSVKDPEADGDSNKQSRDDLTVAASSVPDFKYDKWEVINTDANKEPEDRPAETQDSLTIKEVVTEGDESIDVSPLPETEQLSQFTLNVIDEDISDNVRGDVSTALYPKDETGESEQQAIKQETVEIVCKEKDEDVGIESIVKDPEQDGDLNKQMGDDLTFGVSSIPDLKYEKWEVTSTDAYKESEDRPAGGQDSLNIKEDVTEGKESVDASPTLETEQLSQDTLNVRDEDISDIAIGDISAALHSKDEDGESEQQAVQQETVEVVYKEKDEELNEMDENKKPQDTPAVQQDTLINQDVTAAGEKSFDVSPLLKIGEIIKIDEEKDDVDTPIGQQDPPNNQDLTAEGEDCVDASPSQKTEEIIKMDEDKESDHLPVGQQDSLIIQDLVEDGGGSIDASPLLKTDDTDKESRQDTQVPKDDLSDETIVSTSSKALCDRQNWEIIKIDGKEESGDRPTEQRDPPITKDFTAEGEDSVDVSPLLPTDQDREGLSDSQEESTDTAGMEADSPTTNTTKVIDIIPQTPTESKSHIRQSGQERERLSDSKEESTDNAGMEAGSPTTNNTSVIDIIPQTPAESKAHIPPTRSMVEGASQETVDPRGGVWDAKKEEAVPIAPTRRWGQSTKERTENMHPEQGAVTALSRMNGTQEEDGDNHPNEHTPLMSSSRQGYSGQTVPVQPAKGRKLIVVVTGATGSGKSSTANTLLGEHRFKESSSAVTETTSIQVETVQMKTFAKESYSHSSEQQYEYLTQDVLEQFKSIGATVDQLNQVNLREKSVIEDRLKKYGHHILTMDHEITGYTHLTVVDTPESWMTRAKEIPTDGDTVYLFVINLASPRFYQKQLKDLQLLKGTDGKKIVNTRKCFAVLSHADSALGQITLQDHLGQIEGEGLHIFLTQTLGGRFVALNNSASTKYEQNLQRQSLLEKISDIFADRPRRVEIPQKPLGPKDGRKEEAEGIPKKDGQVKDQAFTGDPPTSDTVKLTDDDDESTPGCCERCLNFFGKV